ncbi:MAG: RNA-binding S4 domain-containing protein [Firmicutes bacterium]|nr:RNA-binding S4 domain-containing protein [Bacillota bacterium]
MRLDKYLKVSRIIKRRTVANEACDAGRVLINGKVAKAGTEVKVGDILEIHFGNSIVRVEVTQILDNARKEAAGDMYRQISVERVERPSEPLE